MNLPQVSTKMRSETEESLRLTCQQPNGSVVKIGIVRMAGSLFVSIGR